MILTGVSRFYAALYHYDKAARQAVYSQGRVICDAGKYSISGAMETVPLYRKSIPTDYKGRFSGGQLTHSSLDTDGETEAFLYGYSPAEIMAGYLSVRRYGIGGKARPPYLGFGTIRRVCDPDGVRLLYQPLILPKVKYLPQGDESIESEQGTLNFTSTSYTAQIYPDEGSGEWIWRFGPVETEEEAEAVVMGVFGMEV